jgi:hypothetical protein
MAEPCIRDVEGVQIGPQIARQRTIDAGLKRHPRTNRY